MEPARPQVVNLSVVAYPSPSHRFGVLVFVEQIVEAPLGS